MSDAAGAIVLAGRILFAMFFGALAGVGHIRRSDMYEGFARSSEFPVPAIAGWPAGIWLVVGAASLAFGVWPDIGSLMIAAFVVPAALYFHPYWRMEDQAQQQTQRQLFWRNAVVLAASLMMFGTFVALGDALRYTITAPLFDF
jgi:uncharacterized membrane protein YphA (DoxX/SURF4 family)